MDPTPFPSPAIDGGSQDESLASPQRRRYLASLVTDQAGQGRLLSLLATTELTSRSGQSSR
jgi:hypothetical protein